MLEPLLMEVVKMEGFKIDNTTNVSCLAFADDMTLMAESSNSVQKLLTSAETFLAKLGMKLSPSKCMSYRLAPKRKAWVIDDPGLISADGTRIPHQSASITTKYLGARLSPWVGTQDPQLEQELWGSCMRIKKLKLKPHQKAELLSSYLIPQFIHAVVNTLPSKLTLNQIDATTRTCLKDILHLSASTTTGLVYAPKRDGGLGFPKLEPICNIACLRALKQLSLIADPVARAIWRTGNLDTAGERYAKAVELHWWAPEADLNKTKNSWSEAERAKWLACKSQGKGVKDFHNDPIGNRWLKHPRCLSHADIWLHLSSALTPLHAGAQLQHSHTSKTYLAESARQKSKAWDTSLEDVRLIRKKE